MIEKKSGKINEIVYNNTVYHNEEYRLYPTLEHLFSILDLIAESGVTTNYLRITPFYRNIKLDIYEEWDVFDFYIECREHVTPSEQDDFWKEHVWWDSPEYSQIQAHLSVDDVKRTKSVSEAEIKLIIKDAMTGVVAKDDRGNEAGKGHLDNEEEVKKNKLEI